MIKMIEVVESFRMRLDIALAQRGMKASDLSKKTGISESTISQYRSGYSTPKKDRLVTIANALCVSPTWLMGIDVDMNGKSLDRIKDADKKDRINRIANYIASMDDEKFALLENIAKSFCDDNK